MHRLQIILLSLIMGVLLLFAVQNTEQMQVSFLLWEIAAPRVIVVSSFFFAGLLCGLFLLRGSRKPGAAHKKDTGAASKDAR